MDFSQLKCVCCAVGRECGVAIAHEGRRSEQANSGICFGFVVVVANRMCFVPRIDRRVRGNSSWDAASRCNRLKNKQRGSAATLILSTSTSSSNPFHRTWNLQACLPTSLLTIRFFVIFTFFARFGRQIYVYKSRILCIIWPSDLRGGPPQVHGRSMIRNTAQKLRLDVRHPTTLVLLLFCIYIFFPWTPLTSFALPCRCNVNTTQKKNVLW